MFTLVNFERHSVYFLKYMTAHQPKNTTLPIPNEAAVSMKTLGLKISVARRAKGLTQRELAGQIGIGLNTMISIEQGNPSVQLGSYIMALWAVGILECFDKLPRPQDGLIPVNTVSGSTPKGKSESLGLSFPYDWSNPAIDDRVIIDRVVERGIFEDLVKVAARYGLESLQSSAKRFIADTPIAAPGLNRMLGNIVRAMNNA